MENCPQQETEDSGDFIFIFSNSKVVKGNITAFWLKLKNNVEDRGCVSSLQRIIICDISCISLPPSAHSVILAINSPRGFFV